MKEFKARKIRNKKKRKKKVRLIIFTFFFFFAYVFMIRYLKDNELKKSILDDNVSYINFDIKNSIVNKVDNVINNPVSLLDKKVKNVSSTKLETNKTSVSNKKQENTSSVVVNKEEPVVYVYNTHQTEEYDGYSVYDATYFLSNKLNNSGIFSYFEEQSVKTFLETNNLKYYKSYTASRSYLDDAKNKYQTLKYFFDIHRDSVSKNISTTTYENKSYAKVLFVVGLDNPSYSNNETNSNKLNEIIKSKVPNISRGVVKHGGTGYNGVYNQDVSENVFLIEVGGKDNTKEEVENTMNVIYESIIEYIRGII